MGVRVFCAGCSADERSAAESAVRSALSGRPAHEAWQVSLVKVKDRWSMTVEASDAGLQRLALVAPEGRIREALLEAIATPTADVPATISDPWRPGYAESAVPPVTAAGERHEAVVCEGCQRPFVVSYWSEPAEPLEEVPVACPHCWQIARALIGQNAALSRDYRANKRPA
jgi:hypothetical protein